MERDTGQMQVEHDIAQCYIHSVYSTSEVSNTPSGQDYSVHSQKLYAF